MCLSSEEKNSPTHKITGCLSKSIWFYLLWTLSVILNATCTSESSEGIFVENMPGPRPQAFGSENHCPSSPQETSNFVLLYQCISLTSNLYKLKSSVVGLRRAKKITKPRPIQKRQFPKRPTSRARWLRMPLRGLSHPTNPTVATRGHLQELLQRLLLKSKGGLRVIPYSQSFALYKHPDCSNIQESRPFGLFITDL